MVDVRAAERSLLWEAEHSFPMFGLRNGIYRGRASIAPRFIGVLPFMFAAATRVSRWSLGGGQGDACEAGDLLVFMEEGEEPANHLKVHSAVQGPLAWPFQGWLVENLSIFSVPRARTELPAQPQGGLRGCPGACSCPLESDLEQGFQAAMSPGTLEQHGCE